MPGDERLGSVAFVRGGALHAVDLDTCRDRVLVRRGVSSPRWSAGGRWIAFGAGKFVARAGGPVLTPLSDVQSYTWAPAGDRLAGVTRSHSRF